MQSYSRNAHSDMDCVNIVWDGGSVSKTGTPTFDCIKESLTYKRAIATI